MADQPQTEKAVRPPHRPECWCKGTGWRTDLGVRCNLPQLSASEAAYVASSLPPGDES